MSEFQEITITQMDKNASKKSNDFPAAFDIAVALSDALSSSWSQIFDGVWKMTIYNMNETLRCRAGT